MFLIKIVGDKVFIQRKQIPNTDNGIDAFLQECYKFLAAKGLYVRRSLADSENISVKSQVIIIKNIKKHSSNEAELTEDEKNELIYKDWKHITCSIKFLMQI